MVISEEGVGFCLSATYTIVASSVRAANRRPNLANSIVFQFSCPPQSLISLMSLK